MNLDSGSVEFGFENGLTTELFERIGHTVGGLGEHRTDWPAHLQGECSQCGRAAAEGGVRHCRQIASEHRGPPHCLCWDAGGSSNRVGHHSG
jgi:hypothetical protein